MQSILNFFRKHWIKHVVAIVMGALLIVIYQSVNNSWGDIAGWYNSTSIAGAVLVLIGGLSVMNNFGTFNLASFYFMRHRVDEKRKENYYEYTVRKAEDRKKDRLTFLPYVLIGALYLIASLILILVARSRG